MHIQKAEGNKILPVELILGSGASLYMPVVPALGKWRQKAQD